MKCAVVKFSNNELIFLDEGNGNALTICQQHRSRLDSKCHDYYLGLFSNSAIGDEVKYVTCPYGLHTSTPFGSSTMPRALYGFFVTSIECQPPIDLLVEPCVTPDDAASTFSLISLVSQDIRQEETGHFEAALHDARHLNHSITQHAERILHNLGYSSDAEWNMLAMQQDEMSRRVLSIYAASRDLSNAISMHEISQDISRAKTRKIATQVHKLFYRQQKISTEQMANANLRYTLGASKKVMMLTPEFRLIPKILFDNAIKYAAKNTDMSIVFVETSHFFNIICKNDGPIIKQEECDMVFSRGGRGSNKSGIKGQGIGLWLAKIITEANNGTIQVATQERARDYSNRRIGTTTITIRIPG